MACHIASTSGLVKCSCAPVMGAGNKRCAKGIAAPATVFFRIPGNRLVELGAQVEI